MIKKTSRVRAFYKKSHAQRLNIIQSFSQLNDQECSLLKGCAGIDFELASRMIENVVSTMPIPLGIAANFIINGKEYFVPMATEEASVVAAASYAAKLARSSGGFVVEASSPIMIGQIQLREVGDGEAAKLAIDAHKKELIALADSMDPLLISLGGGVRDIVCRELDTDRGKMLIVHLLVDVRDAMGANIVNRMAEAISPMLARITSCKIGMRIVSNLSVDRTVKVHVVWKRSVLGDAVIEGILDAYAFACADLFRCATHNKGIMNGIDAVAVATGNDFRAIEAGAHAFSVLRGNGSCAPLSKYVKNADGDLLGELEMPLSVGIVGGAIQSHPVSKVSLKILGVESAGELACVMGAVGLAQNFAALRALVSEGISKGHMRLHSKNIAMAAGAPRELVDAIAQQMVDEDNISVARARELLQKNGCTGENL